MLLSDFVRDHAGGTLDRDVGDQLRDAAEAVILHDGAATVTVELKLTKKGRQLMVAGKVKAKAPTGDPEVALYHLDDETGLTRKDPLQRSFDDLAEINDEPIHDIHDTTDPQEK